MGNNLFENIFKTWKIVTARSLLPVRTIEEHSNNYGGLFRMRQAVTKFMIM
jgi:hypothetical protein